MKKFRLTLKFGPLRVDRDVEARDGADMERIVSQADAFLNIDMPDRIWREMGCHTGTSVTWTPIRKTQWLGRER